MCTLNWSIDEPPLHRNMSKHGNIYFLVTVKGALTVIEVTANTQHAFITSPNYPQPYAE